MQKILVVGKFDTMKHEIKKFLSKYFEVQVASDNYQVINAMMKLKSYDLFLVQLSEMGEEGSVIVEQIKKDYPDIPIVGIAERQAFESYQALFEGEHYLLLAQSIAQKLLFEKICDLLGIKKVFREEKEVVKEKRKNILLVDDSAIQLRTVREFLKHKYDVEVALSATEAMAILEQKVPDLIFLDYDMPIYDGKMTLEMIRNIEPLKEVPVVFLSGVSDEGHIRSVAPLKPAAYLLKPTTQLKIMEIVKHIIGE